MRAADEARHRAGSDPTWEESWWFTFASSDGALGGSLRLALLPHLGRSWVWCDVVGEDRRLVTVVEHEAPLPRPTALDLRCEGLWTDVVCETPLEHWSVGLEAFGVALDDPLDALRGLRGDRVGVGFDLGWEAEGPARADPTGHGYAVPAEVHGEVLLGTEVLAVDGWGSWTHAWGPGPWWGPGWREADGRFDDGTRWHAIQADGGPGRGDLTTGAAVSTSVATLTDDVGPNRLLPSRADAAVGGLDVELHVEHRSPIPITGPGVQTRAVRAFCRTTAADGRSGWAWLTSSPGARGAQT